MNQFIEAYLDKQLDQVTKAEFEVQLAQDEALREAVEEAKRIREDFSWLAVEQGVKQGEQAYWDKKAALKRRKYWLVLSGGIGLMLLGILVWKGQQIQSVSPSKASPSVEQQPINADSTQKPNAPIPVPEVLKNKPKSVEVNQLVAQYFKPYKDNSMEPSLRGDEAPSPSELFQQYYWEGKYRETLDQFETLSATAKANDNLLFIQAESCMALGKMKEAMAIYEAILKRDRTRYMDATAWHLALAYLKLGKTAQAKTELQKMVRSGSKWRGEAASLLQSI